MKRLAVGFVVAVLAVAPSCGKKDKDSKQKAPVATVDPTPKAPEPPTPKPLTLDPELVKKGAYIANVTGCVLCHTAVGASGPDLANPFAGGLEATEELPGGMQVTWRSSNITPDPDTGIGTWTDEQIGAAVRRGIRADDTRLSPFMPYMMYSAMSDDDVNALVAFLRSLEPVSRKVERLEMPPDMATMLPSAPVPNGAAWPAEKRGEYLATLMHCAMCHTPMGPDLAPDPKRAFSGGTPMKIPPQFAAVGTGTTFGANITSDKATGIGTWTEQQIADAIKTMKRPDPKRPNIGFPMFLYQMPWSQLADDDVMAVARYIKGIAPVSNKVQESTFNPGPAFEGMMKGAHDRPPSGPAPGDPPPQK